MKRILIPALALNIMLVSCKDNSSDSISDDYSYEEYDQEIVETPTEQSSTKANDSDAPKTESKPSKAVSNYDEMLDSYEKFVDSYIAIMKKVAKNDMSAMEEYPKLMEKAEKLGDELDKDQGDMSNTQLARYMKIQAKFTKAMTDM